MQSCRDSQAHHQTHGLPYTPAKLLGDPAYNVKLGGHTSAIDREYKGSYTTLVAYNAGPRRVRDGSQSMAIARGSIDPIDWVESIPSRKPGNTCKRFCRIRMFAGRALRLIRCAA